MNGPAKTPFAGSCGCVAGSWSLLFRGSGSQLTHTHTSLSCVLRAGGSVTGPSPGAGPPGKTSLQPPRTVQKVWVPCPKPSLATFIGAQALTGDLKELGVLFKTAGMPVPMGNHSPGLQKENSGFSRQTCSGS